MKIGQLIHVPPFKGGRGEINWNIPSLVQYTYIQLQIGTILCLAQKINLALEHPYDNQHWTINKWYWIIIDINQIEDGLLTAS